MNHESVLASLTEPQVWTLIGVFAATVFGVLGVVSSTFTRVLRAEIGGLRGEIVAKFERVDAQFERVDAQFERVDAQFARLDTRIDHLDRDVQALTRKVVDRPE
ncbi:hypothetical protein [Aeromicrobium sp. 179-A 4D2 NHS]|uniref:hypothetical protein n=1 Tax=Aeromicrobium sp. 179-A 4D2 NHS TaxID=3142375 RepID=UPI00399F1083